MNRIATIAAALRSMVQIIVKLPKEVSVTTRISANAAGHQVPIFHISVHPSDRGRLIGKAGLNMRALRILMNSAAYVTDDRFQVTCDGNSE